MNLGVVPISLHIVQEGYGSRPSYKAVLSPRQVREGAVLSVQGRTDRIEELKQKGRDLARWHQLGNVRGLGAIE
ncbi:MAG: hypothetical protein A3B74_05135 [Candidatus Kerfeldbacteria bacterium RIFCSPHIGHO2_02_FULL_42_14]|uniref:Uncharacterized protein n=1 Tax=Candidatus Kerfeldbacteria bacterium RIFCSPHIGHO2_02_FULL_42_14 TaxID=1798540 RepID=A0A1G2ASW9_9BACT|nr:MAG: hypothetical protein A3B74_05135 [Candidatus Kerfeldbacteria bacterium RIFCSPHIGHO2_02_FULL_42_14]OGY81620.1 MAG: hypothetical protein A3E60_02120 [Candidatus Kerfeldbacteria bacterium RIFCSPHIGHO2_12_FULL_42_13]OGY83222.1 MAG: hypothetical protein A3I91_03525 [Candidatus Kerfeldbacteria bacterium RIFCSPLOWO2_02_FULL_42_19]OGY85527.1 MAG: hypothetical protein A3G01_01515 [Candidatus Kerfeldbacteria bacterium RIFCSPLOWO2_12_FULL_43_9]